MTEYANADKDCRSLVQTIVEAHHDHLKKEKVTIGLLFARTDGDKPPVKCHGRPAFAVVRKTKTDDRALGMPDAIITMDGNERTGWPSWTPKVRAAILDHELEHLKIKLDKFGNPKRDCLDRPLLEFKEHDYEFGGFDCIAERHGTNSIEVITLAILATRSGQLLFPWMTLDNAEKAAKIKKANAA